MILGIPDSVATWLRSGHRGISSETIVDFLLPGIPGVARSGHCHPWDTADFGRCHLLLTACPELRRPFVERMPACSPAWGRLVAIWDDLVELMEREAEANGGRCPETYKLIKLAIGEDGWCTVCRGQVHLQSQRDAAGGRGPLVTMAHEPGGKLHPVNGAPRCAGSGNPPDHARAA